VHDASAWGIFVFAICLIVVAGVIHLAAWEVLKYSYRQANRENDAAYPPHPLAASVPTHPPDPTLEPEPRHDILPRADLEEVRARQRALIGPGALGWVDANHKFARIPLDQAIDRAVNNGLPSSLPATQPTTRPFMPPASAMHAPGGKP
jgi:hypothetical protein